MKIEKIIEESKSYGFPEIPNSIKSSNSTFIITFEGGIQDLHNIIGPKIRFDITNITRKKKRELGYVCQKCNKKSDALDAAHRHGYEIIHFIEQILDKYTTKSTKSEIPDLQTVIDEIINAHYPLEKSFLFLCKSCHNKYDLEQEFGT